MIPLYHESSNIRKVNEDEKHKEGKKTNDADDSGQDNEKKLEELSLSFHEILKNAEDYKDNMALHDLEGSKIRYPTVTNKKMLGYKMIRSDKQRRLSSVEFHKELADFKSRCRFNGNIISNIGKCEDNCEGDEKLYDFASRKYVNFSKEVNLCLN